MTAGHQSLCKCWSRAQPPIQLHIQLGSKQEEERQRKADLYVFIFDISFILISSILQRMSETTIKVQLRAWVFAFHSFPFE